MWIDGADEVGVSETDAPFQNGWPGRRLFLMTLAFRGLADLRETPDVEHDAIKRNRLIVESCSIFKSLERVSCENRFPLCATRSSEASRDPCRRSLDRSRLPRRGRRANAMHFEPPRMPPHRRGSCWRLALPACLPASGMTWSAPWRAHHVLFPLALIPSTTMIMRMISLRTFGVADGLAGMWAPDLSFSRRFSIVERADRC